MAVVLGHNMVVAVAEEQNTQNRVHNKVHNRVRNRAHNKGAEEVQHNSNSNMCSNMCSNIHSSTYLQRIPNIQYHPMTHLYNTGILDRNLLHRMSDKKYHREYHPPDRYSMYNNKYLRHRLSNMVSVFV